MQSDIREESFIKTKVTNDNQPSLLRLKSPIGKKVVLLPQYSPVTGQEMGVNLLIRALFFRTGHTTCLSLLLLAACQVSSSASLPNG